MNADPAPLGLPEHAGVARRFGALLYDAVLVLALMMVAATPVVLATGAITVERFGVIAPLFPLALGVLVSIAFFGGFWTRRGQTLGMQAWRLRLLREDGSLLRWSDAIRRMAAAAVSLLPLGLGYFWIWIDRDGLAWHDRWTSTRVLVVSRKS